MICYDCHKVIKSGDEVFETRQTSGGGQGETAVYSGDFSEVPVHADRRTCIKNRITGDLCDLCGLVNKTGRGFVLENDLGERVLRHFDSDCPRNAMLQEAMNASV